MTDAAQNAAHAEYGASNMDRWTSCLGSSRLCAGLTSYDSDWSEDGTIAHRLMEHCLTWGERTAVPREIKFRGGDPVIVTDEQCRSVNVLLGYVYSILDKYPGAQLSIERRVQIPSSAVPGRMWGTADVTIYVPSISWLFVIDFKHGAGITIDVEDSKQVKFYGVGAMLEHLAAGDPVAGLTLAIVQPRSLSTQGGIKDRDITTAEMFAFHSYAEDKAYATLDPHAPLVPDPDYCRWCPAAGHGLCPVVTHTALAVVGGQLRSLDEVNKDSLPDPAKLNFQQMAQILDMGPLFMAFYKQVRETAIGFARQGGYFPGRKLVFAQMRRQWYGDEDQIAQQLVLFTGRSLDEVYPRKLIGITEAENAMVDEFRFGINQEDRETKKAFTLRQNRASMLARETLAMLTHKQPSGNVDLVPTSDTRPPIDGAATYFAGRLNMEGL